MPGCWISCGADADSILRTLALRLVQYVARPITFDADQVAESAMQAFWSRGLQTSLSDLEVATGLSRSSLYNSFGNREEIFRLCMERYMQFLLDRLRNHFAGRPFREAIAALLEDAVGSNFQGRGCFFFNCLGGAGELSVSGKRVLQHAYRELHAEVVKQIVAAQQRSEFAATQSAADYATWLMAILAGFRAFNLSGLPQQDLQLAAKLACAKLVDAMSEPGRGDVPRQE